MTTEWLCPDGHTLQGTLEKLSGVALAAPKREDDGSIGVEYEGGTEVWWDGQMTVMRDEQVVWVCSEGDDFTTGRLVESQAEEPDDRLARAR